MMGDELFESVEKMSRDTRKAARTLGRDEARYLVANYYTMQDQRIASNNQLKGLTKAGKPHETIAHLTKQSELLEKMTKDSLESWVSGQGRAAEWCLEQKGIGGILAAGLFAHIDIHHAPTAGHIWSFAGLNPGAVWLGGDAARKVVDALIDNTVMTPEQLVEVAKRMGACPKWLAGRVFRVVTEPGVPQFRDFQVLEDLDYVKIKLQGIKFKKKAIVEAVSRRPWNADLKTLAWKIGESIVKVSGREDAYYGAVFAARKRYEIGRNVAGEHVQTAMDILKAKRFKDKTAARLWYGGYLTPTDFIEFYEAPLEERESFAKKRAKAEPTGTPMLPPGHVLARARRATVKFFLSHLQYVLYKEEFKQEPPAPYVIAHKGHAHFHKPPGYETTGWEVPSVITELHIDASHMRVAKAIAKVGLDENTVVEEDADSVEVEIIDKDE